jgi:hypothetical protein
MKRTNFVLQEKINFDANGIFLGGKTNRGYAVCLQNTTFLVAEIYSIQ